MRTDKDLDDNRLSTEDIAGADRHQDLPDDEPRDLTDEREFTDEQHDLPDAETHTETTDMGTEYTETVPAEPAHMGQSNGDDAPLELFGEDEIDRFRDEWRDLQGRFVDDPREAVQGADHLVAEVMKSLATTFTEHKHELEGQWQHGSEAQTEELRLALRRYRTFFNQLLNA